MFTNNKSGKLLIRSRIHKYEHFLTGTRDQERRHDMIAEQPTKYSHVLIFVVIHTDWPERQKQNVSTMQTLCVIYTEEFEKKNVATSSFFHRIVTSVPLSTDNMYYNQTKKGKESNPAHNYQPELSYEQHSEAEFTSLIHTPINSTHDTVY